MAKRPKEVLSLELPCDREAPVMARAALARHERFGWVIGDAMLVVSELVTNAVLYSGCGPEQLLRLTLTVDAGCLRIVVNQPGLAADSAHPRQLSEFTDAGVGLMVVDALVQRWGAERDGGYHFWAEVALTPAGTLADRVG